MARQATLKEVADIQKKKRAEKARRRHQKEQDIAPRVWARENRSDVKVELELEDPTEVAPRRWVAMRVLPRMETGMPS